MKPTQDKEAVNLLKNLAGNISLSDCERDCADEVFLNPALRTNEYCAKCFANCALAKLERLGYHKDIQ